MKISRQLPGSAPEALPDGSHLARYSIPRLPVESATLQRLVTIWPRCATTCRSSLWTARVSFQPVTGSLSPRAGSPR